MRLDFIKPKRRKPAHWTYKGWKNRGIALRRDDYTCQIRGPHCEVVAKTVDHIVPRIAGGSEELGNLRAACWHCNLSKGARSEAAPFFRGLHSMRRPRSFSLSPRRNLVIAGDYSRRAVDGRR